MQVKDIDASASGKGQNYVFLTHYHAMLEPDFFHRKNEWH